MKTIRLEPGQRAQVREDLAIALDAVEERRAHLTPTCAWLPSTRPFSMRPGELVRYRPAKGHPLGDIDLACAAVAADHVVLEVR